MNEAITNESRAFKVEEIINQYYADSGNMEISLVDLVTDIHHLIDLCQLSKTKVFHMAKMHYQEEH
jgi:hypothetical protein